MFNSRSRRPVERALVTVEGTTLEAPTIMNVVSADEFGVPCTGHGAAAAGVRNPW